MNEGGPKLKGSKQRPAGVDAIVSGDVTLSRRDLGRVFGSGVLLAALGKFVTGCGDLDVAEPPVDLGAADSTSADGTTPDAGLDTAETVNMPVGHYEIQGSAYTIAPIPGRGTLFRINDGNWQTGAIAVEGTAVFEVVGNVDEIDFAILTQDPNLTIAAKVGGGLECFRREGQQTIDGMPEVATFTAQQCVDPSEKDEHTVFVRQATDNLPQKAVPRSLL